MIVLISPGTIGAGSLGTYTAVQAWFRERRGTALSLADSGASLGLILIVPLMQHLILVYGWRAAVQMLAGAVLLFVPLQLIVQRTPPAWERLGSVADRTSISIAKLLRSRLLWLVGGGLAASRFAIQLVSIHQAVYLNDHGFDSASVAGTFALAGIAGLIGRPGFGWLSDRIGPTAVYGVLTGSLILGITGLVAAGQTGSLVPLWLFALGFGAALGVGTMLFARQISDFVGYRGFAGAMGLASAIGSLGGVAGGAGAGLAFDATQSYLTSFAAAVIMALLSFYCMWLLGRSGRHQTD
jgi:predicted MFS family arabinose efflux permease